MKLSLVRKWPCYLREILHNTAQKCKWLPFSAKLYKYIHENAEPSKQYFFSPENANSELPLKLAQVDPKFIIQKKFKPQELMQWSKPWDCYQISLDIYHAVFWLMCRMGWTYLIQACIWTSFINSATRPIWRHSRHIQTIAAIILKNCTGQ